MIWGSNTTIASAATDFTEFRDGLSPTLARLGKLKTTLTEGLVAADGGSIRSQRPRHVRPDRFTLSEVNQQDMKFGTFFLDLDPDNATADPPTSSTDWVSATAANLKNFAFADNTGKPFATGTIVGSLPWNNMIVDAGICVRLTKRGDPAVQAPVPTSTFKAKMDFAASTTAGAGIVADSVTGDAGVIKRDGTVVHIPFLTVADGYEHRLVIVNRNPKDVKYTVTFTDQAGGTSTPGDMAKGSAAANAMTTIDAADLVTVADSSATSATVTIVSDPSKVDIATALKTTGSGSYDTVLYKAVAN